MSPDLGLPGPPAAGKFLNLGLDEATKFAVDAGLAGAEAINCAIPAGNVVP